jgi:hypothetical protein
MLLPAFVLGYMQLERLASRELIWSVNSKSFFRYPQEKRSNYLNFKFAESHSASWSATGFDCGTALASLRWIMRNYLARAGLRCVLTFNFLFPATFCRCQSGDQDNSWFRRHHIGFWHFSNHVHLVRRQLQHACYCTEWYQVPYLYRLICAVESVSIIPCAYRRATVQCSTVPWMKTIRVCSHFYGWRFYQHAIK